MSYARVIPRDLFNESSLLKCIGRLWIETEALRNVELRHNGAAFDVVQCPGDGSLRVANISLFVDGNHVSLSRPLNSREPWPLYAETEDDELSVFDDSGDLSAEFRELVGLPPVSDDGRRDACDRCGQDIEKHGDSWLDRGGNGHCGVGLPHAPEAPGPLLIERTERADYYRVPGDVAHRFAYQAVKPGALPPTSSGGYFDLDSLKQLKGDL